MRRPLVCCLAIALLVYPATPGRGQKDPLERYIEELRSPDAEIRLRATEVLMNHASEAMRHNGERGRNAVPALVEALKDKDVRVRRNAVIAIGLIREHPKLAVPALVKMIEDKGVIPGNTSSVSHVALIALGSYGSEARAAVPALLKYAESSDLSVKGWALGILGHIGCERDKVEPLLLQVLNDKDQMELWGGAARALAEFGPNPKGALLLKECFHKVGLPDAFRKRLIQDNLTDAYRKHVAQINLLSALTELGKREADPRTRRDVVAPFLLTVFKDRDRSEAIRDFAIRCLGELGPPAEQTAKELAACLFDEKYNAFSTQIEATLVKIGPEAVGPLLGLLNHPNPRYRGWVAVLLGRFGPSAAPALPALRQLAKDRDRDVAFQATQAIESIERKK